MTGGKRRGHGAGQPPDLTEIYPQVSDILSSRRELQSRSRPRPRPRSDIDPRILATFREHQNADLHIYAANARRPSSQVLSDFSMGRPVPKKRLAVRRNRWDQFRIVASALLRSWRLLSKGDRRQSVRPKKRSKKLQKGRPTISAPVAVHSGASSNAGTHPHKNPELCLDKLGRLDEALRSNPYVPDSSMRNHARLRVVNVTEKRHRERVYPEDFQVREGLPEEGCREPSGATMPSSTYSKALRQTARAGRNPQRGATQLQKLGNPSNAATRSHDEAQSVTHLEHGIARIEKSVARLVAMIPPDHRAAAPTTKQVAEHDRIRRRPAYPGHNPRLEGDIVTLEEGIRRLLEERVSVLRMEKIAEHDERMLRHTQKRCRALERQNDELKLHLSAALRNSTSTEGSFLSPPAGMVRERVAGRR